MLDLSLSCGQRAAAAGAVGVVYYRGGLALIASLLPASLPSLLCDAVENRERKVRTSKGKGPKEQGINEQQTNEPGGEREGGVSRFPPQSPENRSPCRAVAASSFSSAPPKKQDVPQRRRKHVLKSSAAAAAAAALPVASATMSDSGTGGARGRARVRRR